MFNTISVLIAGVGGQGVLKLSRAIAAAANNSYPEVVRTEARGLSQRGGTVYASVRFGLRSCTPLIFTGCESLILSLELLEACRLTDKCHPDGVVISDNSIISPAHLLCNNSPDELALKQRAIEAYFASTNNCLMNFGAIATAVECPKAISAALLGAASNVLPLDPEQLREELLNQVAKQYRDGNRRAFDAGRIEFGLLARQNRNVIVPVIGFDQRLGVVA